jgi:hypothetical protein
MTKLDEQYLMPFGMHAPDDIWPSSLLDIDLTFAQIVSRDEEGSFGTICPEHVEEM